MPLSLISAPALAQDPTPPPTTPPSAPATPTGKALAQAKKDNRRIEIESLRSENTTYYANPDGKTLRMEQYLEPIRVKNADGKGFTPIDTTLIEANGVIKPKAAKGGLTLSAGGDTEAIRSKSGDLAARIDAPRTLPKPTLNGNTATYPSAYGKGIDLVVTATPTGFRQQIVIRQRPAEPVTFRVPVELPKGISFGKNAKGQPTLKNQDGKHSLDIRPAALLDAKAADANADLGTVRVGRAQVSLDDSALVYSPDAAFLADPATTFPVTMAAVDDDWYECTLGGDPCPPGDPMDTYINDVDLTDSWDMHYRDQMWVGKSYASGIAKRWRAYIQFPLPNATDPFWGSNIQNADLELWNYLSNDCGEFVGSGITARRVTSDWDHLTLQWGNQPSVTDVGADTEYGAYSPDCAGSMNYEHDLIHSVDTIVQDWADGETNYGFQLRAGDESELRNWRRYRSREQTSGYPAHGPRLTVDFEPPAPPEVETIHYTYRGPLRPTPPTYEEARAMEVKTETSPQLPGVSEAQLAELEREPEQAYNITSGLLQPLPNEAGEADYSDPDMTLEDMPEDVTPPAVVANAPAQGEQDVSVDAKVTVTFSEPVWEAALSVNDPAGSPIATTVAMDAPKRIATFTPAQKLLPGVLYTATVSKAMDAYGNRMSPRTWSFVTKSEPAARWTFDENSGRVANDSSAHGHHAAVNGTAAWTAGRSGSALSNTSSQARASASVEASRSGQEIVVTSETSATSITYAQPDGRTLRTELSTRPVRALRDGAWVPIDTTLVEQGGKLRPKTLAEGAVVEISAGGTDPFVKMSADGKSHALRWPTPLPKPTVKGSVATYTDAAGVGADLVVTALPTGFRHEVVLRQRPAKQVELRIGVEDEGLTLTEGKGGRLLLKGKDTKLVAAGTRPVVSDGGGGKGRPASVKRGEADGDVATKDGRTELVVRPDQAFLADAATMYPVRVAAAVTLPVNADVEVTSDNDADFPGDPTAAYMMAGTRTGGFKHRVHLKFDTPNLTGSTVTDAKLSMNTIDAQNCGAALANGIQVARLTGAWDPGNVHWANKPAFTTEDASTNFKGVNQDCATWPDSMEWNVTGIAQDWAAGAADHGLVLKSPGEANINNYRAFTSAENTDEFGSPPKLTLTTSGPASAPTVSAPAISPAQTVNGATVTTSLTPQLAATVADAAGGSLTGEFEVEHDPTATGQGSGQIWTGASQAVTSGGQATVGVPAGKLADGWKVRWRARAANTAASTTSAWSDWQKATVDVPNPTVGAFQVTPSQVVDGVTVATSLTPALHATITDPAAQPLRAEFEVEHDPTATGQGSGQIWTGGIDGVASGTQASATVPDGKLTDGWKVRWRVRAANTSTTVGSPWSDWQAMTVDVPDPVSEPAVGALQVTPSEQVDGTTVTPTRTPSLLAQVIDPAGKPLRAEAEIEHDPAATGQSTGQIWTGGADNIPAGTQATITVPADKLTDGWKVRWRARAVSATAISAWSDWQSFTVSLPKPTATGLTITPSKVVDGVTVTDTLTPALQATLTHPTGQALRAEAEIEHDPSATGQGTGQIWAAGVDGVASGAQASLTVPGGKLADGWKVRWRLRAVTGDASSAWSDWQQVIVDVVQPGEEPLAQTAGPVIRTDQSFTAAAWVRWSDKDGDYTIIEQKGAQQAPFKLGNSAEHGLEFTFTSADVAGATVEGVLSGVEAPVGQWFHIAGVYDATTKTVTLYLNGAVVNSAVLSSSTWNADAPMTLGSRMRGDLDDTQIHQAVLSPVQIRTLAGLANGEAQAARSAPAVANSPMTALDNPDPFPYFDYDHYTVDSCRKESEKESDKDDDSIWTAVRPYSGCIVAWHGVSQWEPDWDGPSGKKKRVGTYSDGKSIQISEVQSDITFRSTMVVNTYLGNANGTGVVPSKDGVTAQQPRYISMWMAIDKIDYDGIFTPNGLHRMTLEVTPTAGEPSSTCLTKFGQNKTALLKEWDDVGSLFYSFESYPTQDFGRGQACSIRPWVTLPTVFQDGSGTATHVPLWDRKVTAGTGSILKRDNALTVRCDSKKFGPGAPLPNTPPEKVVNYKGACIFPKAARVYTMSMSHVRMGEVAKHVNMAFTTPDLTIPTRTNPSKVFPGNWNAQPGSPQRVRLERLYKGAKAPDGRTWYSKNVAEKDRICEQDFPNAAAQGKECDEFPFAVTYEGAGKGDGNYSILALDSSHNSSEGWHRAVFFARYRVGGGNPFWVSVQP
ncbi:DNRLRE domain-containing protein [Nonomuraea sp. NPDC051941]|uniref:DNRLRE domain-containing protein n=1 Tax=Nonomuraea sp. NPDC051941 TaxID=3364373 RepID=UPI0037CC1286